MRIGDIASRNVVVCGPRDGLDRAAMLMWEHDCGCIPVVEDGRPVGVVTDRDVCMAALLQGKRLCEIPVRHVMSAPLLVCVDSDSIPSAAARMERHQVRRLIVLDAAGAMVGIVSLVDLARHAVRSAILGGDGYTPTALAHTFTAIGAPESAKCRPAEPDSAVLRQPRPRRESVPSQLGK